MLYIYIYKIHISNIYRFIPFSNKPRNASLSTVHLQRSSTRSQYKSHCHKWFYVLHLMQWLRFSDTCWLFRRNLPYPFHWLTCFNVCFNPFFVSKCLQAPTLLQPLLDGLVWRSRTTQQGMRRVNYYIKNLLQELKSWPTRGPHGAGFPMAKAVYNKGLLHNHSCSLNVGWVDQLWWNKSQIMLWKCFWESSDVFRFVDDVGLEESCGRYIYIIYIYIYM